MSCTTHHHRLRHSLRFPLLALVATLATLLVVTAVAGCGGESSSDGAAATDYEGLWVDKAPFGVEDEGGGTWVRIEQKGDGYEVTWLVPRGQPPTLQVTKQEDGSLRPGVDADGQMIGSAPVALSALVLDDQGRVEILAPEGAWDDDPSDDTPVLVLERATEEQYAEVQTIWAGEGDFYDALTALQEAIDTWAADHDWQAPPVKEVKPGGAIEDEFQAANEPWPTFGNGTLLLPGRDRGEYVYTAEAHGFTLKGTSPTGKDTEVSSNWSEVQ